MHQLGGFTSPTLAHERKLQLLKHFLARAAQASLNVHYLLLSGAVPAARPQPPRTHQEAVAQSVEAVLVDLQFIPVQLPAARGPDDEGQAVEHGLADAFGLQSPANHSPGQGPAPAANAQLTAATRPARTRRDRPSVQGLRQRRPSAAAALRVCAAVTMTPGRKVRLQ